MPFSSSVYVSRNIFRPTLFKCINAFYRNSSLIGGSVLKGHGQGVDTYCLGLHNKMNIVVPISNNVYDYKGRELNITGYNMNGVSYMYDKWGIDMCE